MPRWLLCNATTQGEHGTLWLLRLKHIKTLSCPPWPSQHRVRKQFRRSMLPYYTALIVLGLQTVSCASSTSTAALSSQPSGSQAVANNNGLCGEFISTCYSMCFASVKKSGLGHVPVVVGYACNLSETGQYSVACNCGSTDDTAAVLAALPTPLPTVTTTVAISKTTMNTIFTTSTATTLVTVPFTTGTTGNPVQLQYASTAD